MLSFLATALIIELTPGPNMTWLALLGASRGRVAALAAVAGIALGLVIAGAAAAFGLSALIADTPWLLHALRWAGAIYLFYLAWDAWRSTPGPAAVYANLPSLAHYFRLGLFTNILNPKAYLFYVTIVPQFIDAALPSLPQLLWFAALFVAVATAVHAAIAVLAGSFAAMFDDPARGLWLNRVFAVLLVAVAVWFLWS